MKKTLLIAASLSIVATSVFAKDMDVQDLDCSKPSFSNSSFISDEGFETKKDQSNTATPEKTAEDSAEDQKTEGWGTWAYNKAWGVGEFVAKKGARVAGGVLATAYLTPYLNPAVNVAGELADWGTCGIVTAGTGCYPLGWVAGKGAKVVTVGAGYYVAPAVAYTIGHNAPEIATGAYSAGKTLCNGAYYAGEALYNGATGAYNYFYGSSEE